MMYNQARQDFLHIVACVVSIMPCETRLVYERPSATRHESWRWMTSALALQQRSDPWLLAVARSDQEFLQAVQAATVVAMA